MFKQLWATKHPHAAHEDANGLSLRRHLGPWGLTALGIGAVIGGGIFVITGQAAANHAGPAIMLSFVLAAICCAFCALAYAEREQRPALLEIRYDADGIAPGQTLTAIRDAALARQAAASTH